MAKEPIFLTNTSSSSDTMSAAHPSMWSISYEQLLDFDNNASKEFGTQYPQMTMHDISERMIKPICQRTGTSYALHLNPNGGLKIRAFITHAWNELFADFVQSIKQVFQTFVDKPNLWICSFALYQGNATDIASQLGLQDDLLQDAPFVKALKCASSYVVVRNSICDVYSRIWCVCELMYARNCALVPNRTYITGPDSFASLKSSCVDAKATRSCDKARVLKALLNEFDYQQVDEFIRWFRMQEAPDSLLTWKRLRELYNESRPDLQDSEVSDSDSSNAEFTYVSVSLDLGHKWERNHNWNKAIADSKRAINKHINDIYASSKANDIEYRQLEIDHKKEKILGVFEIDRVVVKLSFDVDISPTLTNRDRQKIKNACFRLAEILREAGADDALLERIISNGLWKGSVFILLRASPVAFSLMLDVLNKPKTGEKYIDLGNSEDGPVHLVSMNPLFLVENPFCKEFFPQLKEYILEKCADLTLYDEADTVLFNVHDITLYVPQSQKAWNNILKYNFGLFENDFSEKIVQIKTKPINFDNMIDNVGNITTDTKEDEPLSKWLPRTSTTSEKPTYVYKGANLFVDHNGIYIDGNAKKPEMAHIVVDSTVNKIHKHAFQNCTSLTVLAIPTSVTEIGYGAFDGCSSLTTIEIPNSVTSLGDNVFLNCSSLRAIEIPKSVTSIGYFAFLECTSLASITFLNSVTSIANHTFRGCSSLTNIEIPDSVTSIGDFAFNGCSSLMAIDLPNSIELIGESAFSFCSALPVIKIPNSVKSIGDGAFSFCSSLTAIAVPISVTSLGNGVFSSCSFLNVIEIPNTVASIGNSAFNGCSSLATIDIPNSITSIGNDAFDGCSSLTTIGIHKSVTTIGDNAFNDCSSLTVIEIPDSAISIGTNAFHGCSSLTGIKIPNSVVLVGNGAFSLCSLLRTIDIPNSVTTIGNYAFNGCSSLTIVQIPNSVTSIGNGTFLGCSSLESVEIPDSVKSIGSDALKGCSSLTTIEIPESITSIGNFAFYGCSSLTTIQIPNLVTSIANYTFRGCSSLTTIEVPESVTSIGDFAFYGCSSLTAIQIPNSVTTLGYEAFRDCWSLTAIEIPSSVALIGANVFHGCSSLVSIKISNSDTSIGNNAFRGCTSLVSVDIPNSIASIGEGIFDDCPSLATTDFASSVK